MEYKFLILFFYALLIFIGIFIYLYKTKPCLEEKNKFFKVYGYSIAITVPLTFILCFLWKFEIRDGNKLYGEAFLYATILTLCSLLITLFSDASMFGISYAWNSGGCIDTTTSALKTSSAFTVVQTLLILFALKVIKGSDIY